MSIPARCIGAASTVVVVALAFAGPAGAFAQSLARDLRTSAAAGAGTGVIRGRVVAATTHDPLRNARVLVTGDRDFPPVVTDAEGRFAIGNLPAGEFRVAASKAGFAAAAAGARGPGGRGRAIVLAAGQLVDAVVIELRRGAAISGIVLDTAGEPVAGASVMVERAGPTESTPAPPRVGLTDERGQYRVGSLSEGRVLVSVFSSPRDVVMLPNGAGMMTTGPGGLGDRVYYPGSGRSEPLTLAPGDEKRAVDFTVAARRMAPPRPEAPRDRTTIAGRVVGVDGRPIAGAQVVLAPLDGVRTTTQVGISDADGVYRLILPLGLGGVFRIVAHRDTYLPAAYGQRGPTDAGDDVAVSPGASIANLDITLLRPAIIAGTVFDENGDPIEGAVVRAFTMQTVGGRRRLAGARSDARPTDDLGRYRLSGLAPGQYLIAAFVGQITGTDVSVSLPGYTTTFFPGTPDAAESQPVAVGPAQELSDVDVSLKHVKTARVAGRALDAAGEPIGGGIALMPSRRSGVLLPATFGARIDRDGRFEFSNVAAGEYVLQASRHRQAAWNEGESTSMFVTVTGDDVSDLELRTSRGSTITGRIVVDGSSVNPRDLEISPIPADPDLVPTFAGPTARALIDDQLRFELAGLQGPRRLRVLRLPAGFALEAIRCNGVDISDAVLPLGTPA